jgi:hypothetical protein
MSLAFPWWERAGGDCQWDDRRLIVLMTLTPRSSTCCQV